MTDATENPKPEFARPTPSMSSPVNPGLQELLRPRNAVSIEVKAHFELDDARIFDLNGDGLKVTVVTEN